MLRIIITMIVPLLLPSLLYLVWYYLNKKHKQRRISVVFANIGKLLFIGLILMVTVLVVNELLGHELYEGKFQSPTITDEGISPGKFSDEN